MDSNDGPIINCGPGWTKDLMIKLVRMGLNIDEAGQIIGEITEHRQVADREGYKRGYNNGYRDAENKLKSSKCPYCDETVPNGIHFCPAR